MKKLLKISAFVLIFGLALGLAGCPDKDKDPPVDDIFQEDTSGRLLTTNLGAEDLVLFFFSVRGANLIGGLPANANRFKMKLPDSNKMYVIYAVKYSDYKGKSTAEIANLKVLDSALVYSDPVNETSCRIGDPKAGGEGKLNLRNQTNYYIEVGDGSPNDEDIFFVMRPYADDSVFVIPRSEGYRLCFKLILPIKKGGKIIGTQRQFINNWTRQVSPQKGEPDSVTIDSTGIASVKPNYQEGYLRIINNYGDGLRVNNGSMPIESTLERNMIRNGEEMVWELQGNADAPGRPYAQFNLQASQVENDVNPTQFHIRNGYKYTLTINPFNTTPKYNLSEGTPLDPEAEEITW
jgi:hypothetical protein